MRFFDGVLGDPVWGGVAAPLRLGGVLAPPDADAKATCD